MAKSHTRRRRRRQSPPERPISLPSGDAKRQQRQVSFETAIQLTTEALAAGQYGRAEEICSAVLDKWPNHPQAMNFWGVAVLGQGRAEEGLAILNKACEYWPDDAQMHCNLGWAHEKLGREDEAIACYRRAADLAPDVPEPAWNLANLLLRRDAQDETAAILSRLIEQHPSHTISYITLAQAKFRQGEEANGERLLRQATALDDDVDEAWYHLGLYLLANDRADEAADALRSAVGANPRHARAEATLGHVLVADKHDYADAAEPLVRAVNLNPNEVQAWLDLGRAMGMIGHFDNAIDIYEKLLDRDPDNAEAAHQIDMMKRRKKTFSRG
jgi:tetratricopeptide (TPR) repeat protein